MTHVQACEGRPVPYACRPAGKRLDLKPAMPSLRAVIAARVLKKPEEEKAPTGRSAP
jgi:hypothetical protein